ncbi:hypothetical protein TNCV_32801 [Trichonephila clavipes]|nr:hypothetical protein TNCV_32801 [Trichonephila clavipes]
MALGYSLPQINLGVQGVTQGGHHKRMLSKGVILMHGNVRPHIAVVTQKLLQQFRWKIWSHLTYSPDLALSEYFLSPGLKEHLSAGGSFKTMPLKHSPRPGSMDRNQISTKMG